MQAGSSHGLTVEDLPAWQRERRQRIVDAALRALEGRNYQDVQIRDVAAEAGVALGTLYRYFPSKELVYATALRTWGLELEVRTGSTVGADGMERLRHKAERVTEEFVAHPEIFGLFQNLAVSADAEVLDRLEQTADSGRYWFATELAPLGDAAADELSALLWSTVALAARDPRQGSRFIDRFFQLLAGAYSGVKL